MLRRITQILVSGAFLAACVMMTPEEEARLGAEQHPKVIEAYGGVYDDPAIRDYVEGVMKRIGKASDKPDMPFRVTVLDTHKINAFALPGGYTYVTRGLLALANSEAELAGVIGHEIAHVTERHTAKRRRNAGGAVALSILVGVFAGTQGVHPDAATDLVLVGGMLALASYGRGHEYEADTKGIESLARAGYDPNGQANLLAGLQREAEFFKREGGNDWFASHPNTEDRIARARQKAAEQEVLDVPRLGIEEHLAAIDGMIYGKQESNLHIRIVTVKAGDTLKSILREWGRYMSDAEEFLQMFNGLPPGSVLVPGQKLKVITR